MFTGIITDLGKVRELKPGAVTRLVIETKYDTAAIDLGASVACNGVCLSVVEKGSDWLAFEASNETLSVTTLGHWQVGTKVNLERALRLGDELGGHLVSGHVDGIGTIKSVRQDGGSVRLTISAPKPLSRFIASKGSIAMDGVSLTVNEVGGVDFGVNLIPITLEATNLGSAHEGDRVNLEIDMMARYLARLTEKESA
jgi:riboflavin synthase